jgi:hypothetical protein
MIEARLKVKNLSQVFSRVPTIQARLSDKQTKAKKYESYSTLKANS